MLTIEQILALDEKRTQGEWTLSLMTYKYEIKAVGITENEVADPHVVSLINREANAQYIAAMPDAVKHLRDLLADNKRLRDIIHDYLTHEQIANLPVQVAEPIIDKAEVQSDILGRTGGANPPTGIKTAQQHNEVEK